MSIILLRGFSHSGKDFIGQILSDNYNYKRFAFADSLKKMVQLEFKCSWDKLHTQEGKIQICETDTLKRTYRQILIDEALRLRNIDSGIFAKYCSTEINGQNYEESPERIVITDWRYPNEITILENSFPGYKIIPVHIQREGQNKSPVDNISEYQLTNRINDFILINKMDESIHQDIKILIDLIHK